MSRRGESPGDSGGMDIPTVEVDVEHLGNIKKYLKELSDYIENDILPDVVEANKDVARTADDQAGCAFGSPEMGVVSDLSGKVNSTYQAVYNSLAGMKADFDNSGEAVSKIAKKYSSTEERNEATMKDFTTNFGTEQPETAPAGTGAPSPSTGEAPPSGSQDDGGYGSPSGYDA